MTSGHKMADQLSVIFKAYTDAKVCNDQQTINQAKAIEAANKALKQVPNYGFAEYCLGEIAQKKDSASDEALQALQERRHRRSVLAEGGQPAGGHSHQAPRFARRWSPTSSR